jgi:D-beta-D-heptose 7-phosphate kinase/D-beta-D-heptose 1-phosphate adenosyltransferase
LVDNVSKCKNNDEKIVMTNGCFDILHAGHVSYLQQAKKLGHKLIVAVNSDQSVKRLKGESRPINNVIDRMIVLGALDCVDWVVEFDQDTPAELYKEILPDVLVKGGDYTVDQIAGADHVINAGGAVEILSFVDGKSTTETIRRINTI